MLSNVQSHNRNVTQGTISNQKSFCKFKSPAFIEPVSAASLLLETAFLAQVCLMNQLEAVMTPLFATVLQLLEQFNQCLTKYTAQGFFNQNVLLPNQIVMYNRKNLHRC